MSARILIGNTTDATTSSGHLLERLADRFRQTGLAQPEVRHLGIGPGLRGKLRAVLALTPSRLGAIRRADVILVHTSVVFFAAEILLGRLFGKRVKAIYWDSYPESFHAFSAAARVPLRLLPYRLAERALLRLCHRVYVPNPDYDAQVRRAGLRATGYLPLWPFTPRLDPTEGGGAARLQLGFAGAVNPIRGLPGALDRLAAAGVRADVHVYGSRSPLDLRQDTADKLTVIMHGRVDQHDLTEKLRQLDAGLVTLHPAFRLPAFPSKIVSYISSGLPIVYIGPSQPALEAFLRDTGVGLTIGLQDRPDLARSLAQLRAGFGAAQTRALEAIELNEARLAEILQ